MKNLLLIISIIIVGGLFSCNKGTHDNTPAKEEMSGDTTAVDKAGIIDHAAPNQSEIDSIKESKTKGKK